MEEALKTGFAKFPKAGEVISGTVAQKEGAVLYVDLGQFGTGMVYGREFQEASEIIKQMKAGDPVSAKVVEFDNERGFVELSLKDAGYTLAWDELIRKRASGETVDVVIKEVNKGGLMAELDGVMAFMPVSQLATKHYPRVEGGDKQKILQELMKFVGQVFKVRVIDVNQQEDKLIVSEREAQDNDLKKVLLQYKVGDVVEGAVSGVVNFGVFVRFMPQKVEGVEISELEGLVHISELDWQLIEHPADMCKVGDKVQAKIISLDGDKISLSLKALKKDPWDEVDQKFKKGDVIRGTVAKLNPFGAFVKVDADIKGLCHISEFGSDAEMKKHLDIGKTYDFNIQTVSKQEHKMALGFGAVSLKPAKDAQKTKEGKEEKADTEAK
ncbi:S1 RNA-binding domain-containing protein [Candidatus Azambacteria bacterium]|nr:S1 RNA-binding domain-containing protein [Candidatus Azambacteria bacterium]